MKAKQFSKGYFKHKDKTNPTKIEMGKCRGCGRNAIWSWGTAGYCPRCMRGKKMDWRE